MYKILSCATIPGQSGPGVMAMNENSVFPQISNITGDSTSDSLVFT